MMLLNSKLPVLSALVTFPLIGVWCAEVEVDTDQESDLSGVAVLSASSQVLDWVGTFVRGGIFAGKGQGWIVGGAGGLSRVLPPKFYKGVPLRTPLQDALVESGEVLNPTSSSAALSSLLPSWARTQGPASKTVAQLALLSGAHWRVLLSGEVFLGQDTFAEFTNEFTILKEDTAEKSAELDMEAPFLTPGVSLNGRRVGRVQYCFEGDAVRSLCWFEA